MPIDDKGSFENNCIEISLDQDGTLGTIRLLSLPQPQIFFVAVKVLQ